MAERHVYLRIEGIDDYSPVEPMEPTLPPVQYRRDGMRYPGHEDGTIPQAERDARALRAVVYREYLDADYLIPKTTKIVAADINEPRWDHRVPGTVIWAYVGDTLKVHVFNADFRPHSFHVHGLEYGIDSDGAWPMGVTTTDGRRSDEICPGQSWTYTFRMRKEMIGAWPFHDHTSHVSSKSVMHGLFGGIIVRKRRFRFPIPLPLPKDFEKLLRRRLKPIIGPGPLRREALPAAARRVLDDELELLGEWWLREHKLFPFPIHDRRLHVPVFFHEMMSEESTPLFDSGDLEENGVGIYVHKFDNAGSFDYFCQFHPNMTGTVEVVAGAPASQVVNILDLPNMGFYPDSVQVAPGGEVEWRNQSAQHHTVTSSVGGSMATHCINGRGFVGNSPTIIARAGAKIRWYVFNLDFGHGWHNFHPHNQRWSLAGENLDVRSFGPAESFTVDTTAPTVLILPDDVAAIQDAATRPAAAQEYKLMGDFVFHCHVHHHMVNGMIGVVRSYQEVWLTPELKQKLEDEVGIHLFDDSNPIPEVEMGRCKNIGGGKWEELTVDPEVTFMHACLMAGTDNVLYWGYTRDDQTRVFDPAGPSVAAPTNQPASLPGMDSNLSDLWSAEHTLLNDAAGTILAHGGFAGAGGMYVNAFLFDPATEVWSQTGSTTDPRFYSTTITTADGGPVTLYGSGSKTLERYDPAAGTWSAPELMPAEMNHHRFYPWTYVLPDGRVFIAGPHDPTHRLKIDPIANVEVFSMNSGNRSTGGEKASSVLLPLHPPDYAPRIVVLGGNTATSRKTAEIIDLSDAAPAWQSLPDLNIDREQQVNSVLLPNGTVLVAGGAGTVPDGGPVEVLDSKNTAAGFQMGPTMTYHRGYHSAAILLTDGSVLFGGDPNSGVFERFYPLYYYQPRPQIAAAPASAVYGTNFDLDSPEAASIDEVVLLRPGGVTHGFNMTQRAIVCDIGAVAGNTLTIQPPPHGDVAPPGWYLLFLVNGARVPSVGHWIRLTT